jgi:hypothetical protein
MFRTKMVIISFTQIEVTAHLRRFNQQNVRSGFQELKYS